MTLNQGTTIVKKQPELLDHDKERVCRTYRQVYWTVLEAACPGLEDDSHISRCWQRVSFSCSLRVYNIWK